MADGRAGRGIAEHHVSAGDGCAGFIASFHSHETELAGAARQLGHGGQGLPAATGQVGNLEIQRLRQRVGGLLRLPPDQELGGIMKEAGQHAAMGATRHVHVAGAVGEAHLKCTGRFPPGKWFDAESCAPTIVGVTGLEGFHGEHAVRLFEEW